MREARPISEWHEEIGDVLWWKFPIEEAPYIGTPNDLGYTVEIDLNLTMRTHADSEGKEASFKARRDVGGWPGYHTHFTRFEIPEPPK